MKFKTFIHLLFAFLAALLVASCGGGGAAADPNRGGELTVAPAEGSFYAGVASTITISGGRTPYAVASADPQLLAVPSIVNGHSFQVVPNNPGVVDPGLTDTDVPRRTTTVTIRDSQGVTVFATIHVIRNFLTGYSISFIPTTCPAATPVCAGGNTVVQLAAITNGTLHGNEQFRFDSIRGGCKFIDFDGTQKDFVFVQSDHNGIAQALLRCNANVPPGIGLLRVTHVSSGVTVDHAFVISAAGASTGGLTADPASVTFTGVDSTKCGTGSADIMIFGGQEPFTATSSFPGTVSVTPTSSSNPGRFTVSAFDPNTCVSATVIVQDATGAHIDIAVKSEKGSGSPPAPAAFDVQPATIASLACSTSASVTAVGGSGSYFAASTHPRIVAVVSGSTVTITRCGTGSNPVCAPVSDGVTAYPTTGIVSVSDGATIKPVTITATPATCP